MVERGSAGVVEETGIAGCGKKGQRQQGRRQGARERDAAELQKGRGCWMGMGNNGEGAGKGGRARSTLARLDFGPP